jgi:acyl carrier protein
MTQETAVFEAVVKAIVNETAIAPQLVKMESTIDDVGVDSLGIITVMTDIEDALGIRFPQEIRPINTVAELVAYTMEQTPLEESN